MSKKSKMLSSVLAVILMAILVGNVYSLATEGNSNPVTITTITAANSTASNETANNTNTNTNTNTVSITATTNTSTNSSASNITTVSASVNNIGNNTANNSVNNTTNNTSNYANTSSVTNSTKLPHTGTSSKSILFAVVFAISAVYAYKKVTDYNV